MKICIIGKISPIQGGVSRLNFWLCYALAKKGHEVHLVTNANEVEEEYRAFGGEVSDSFAGTPLEDVADNLTIHATDPAATKKYIPYANPFLTKMVAMATDVVRKYDCELILGNYFEPYGMAAYMTSVATKVPFGLRHAGSDVGRLLQSRELHSAYKSMILAADFIYCSATTGRRFVEMGVSADKLSVLRNPAFPDFVYNPDREPLDFVGHINAAKKQIKSPVYHDLLETFHHSHYKATRPTVGIYGKIGEQKGTFDLIKALGLLKKQGVEFNFFALTSGSGQAMTELKQAIFASGIENNTIWMPFVPHWKVPEFIKLCDVTTFLERDFGIPIHRPGVAMEILYCGCCLLVSQEIVNKQSFKSELIDKENVLIAEPKDIEQLAEKLRYAFSDTERANAIGMRGRELITEHVPDFEIVMNGIDEHFKNTLEQVQQRDLEMSMIEYQAFISRLYTSDIFRDLFKASPDAAMAKYTLSEEEVALLKKLEMAAVEEFGQGLEAKLYHKLEGMYQRTFKTIPKEEMLRLWQRFFSVTPPYPGESKLALSDKFGQFFEEATASNDVVPPYVSEVVRFERERNQLAFSALPEDTFFKINARASSSEDLTVEDRLVTNHSLEFKQYAYDIEWINTQIDEEKAITELPQKGEYEFVIYSIPDELRPKVLKVNGATRLLIELMQDVVSLGNVIDQFETRTGMQGTSQDITEAVAFLIDAKIVNRVALN